MVQHQHIDQVKVDKVSEDLSEKVNDDGKVIQNSGEHSLNVGEGLVNRSLSRGKILGADLTRSTPNSSALDLGNIFRTGWPILRDMECERILCQWAIGAAGWALKY
jgi:hypothetical protein